MDKHPIDVVDVSVLPVTIVMSVLMHGDLWTIEDTGLKAGGSIRQSIMLTNSHLHSLS